MKADKVKIVNADKTVTVVIGQAMLMSVDVYGPFAAQLSNALRDAAYALDEELKEHPSIMIRAVSVALERRAVDDDVWCVAITYEVP